MRKFLLLLLLTISPFVNGQKHELGLSLFKLLVRPGVKSDRLFVPTFLWGLYYDRDFGFIHWYNSFEYGENIVKLSNCSNCSNAALSETQITEYNYSTGFEIRSKKDHFNVGCRISGLVGRYKLYRIEKGYYMNPETFFFWTPPEGYTRKYNIIGGQLELVLSAEFKHGITLNGDFGFRIGKSYYKYNVSGLPKYSKSTFMTIGAPTLRIGYAF